MLGHLTWLLGGKSVGFVDAGGLLVLHDGLRLLRLGVVLGVASNRCDCLLEGEVLGAVAYRGRLFGVAYGAARVVPTRTSYICGRILLILDIERGALLPYHKKGA